MKNVTKTTLIILLGMMCLSVNAQRITIKGGANLSTVNNNPDMEYFGGAKIRPGFHIGVMSEFPFTDRFSFESGLLLSHRGFKVEGSESYEFFGEEFSYSLEMKYSAYYLNLPLTAKMRLPLNRKSDFYLQAGGYLGFGLFGEGKYTMVMDGQKDTDNEKEDWGYNSRFDGGLTIGTGVEIERLLLGISYDLGLVPFFDGEGTHSNLNISLGYTLFNRS